MFCKALGKQLIAPLADRCSIPKKLFHSTTAVEQILFAQASSYEGYMDQETFGTRAMQAFTRTLHLVHEVGKVARARGRE